MKSFEELEKLVDDLLRRITILEKKLKDKPRLHYFNQSPYFNIEEFKKHTPDWNEDERQDYYDRAIAYSNTDHKYIDWLLALKKWKRSDDKKNGVMNGKQRITKY